MLLRTGLRNLGWARLFSGATSTSCDMSSSTIIRVERNSSPFTTDSPFLFAVYHNDNYPRGNEQMGPDASLAGHAIGADFGHRDGWSMYHGSDGVPGFPKHPHRGFETITVTRHGFVDHTDSLGSAGRFGDGDVQWMTAGAGISHAEMIPLLDRKNRNQLELFQVWVNLPKKSKMVDPSFKMLWHEDMPVKDLGDYVIKLIAGKLAGFESPPPPPPDSYAVGDGHKVLVATLELGPKAGSWTLPAEPTPNVHRNLYAYSNAIVVDGKQVPGMSRIVCRADRDVNIAGVPGTAAGVLILQGKDIGEPVVQHGPFVGNTREDIIKAFSDYQRTEFGKWPWPSDATVHKRSDQRFATYGDGTREDKPRRKTD